MKMLFGMNNGQPASQVLLVPLSNDLAAESLSAWSLR
jgi:hypothetical protein